MKKVFLLIVFISISHLLSAQGGDEGSSLGIRAGVNYSFVNIKKATEKLLPGVGIGVFSKGTIAGKFSLQPELSATLQNCNVNFNEFTEESKIKLSLYYAECTFLGVYNINEHISIHAGPFISYLFHASIKNENGQQSELINRINFYDINYGLIYGGAIELKRFDIGMRYNQGLFTIGKETDILGYKDLLRTRDSFFQLYCAYIF